jgi:hypothetical protein
LIRDPHGVASGKNPARRLYDVWFEREQLPGWAGKTSTPEFGAAESLSSRFGRTAGRLVLLSAFSGARVPPKQKVIYLRASDRGKQLTGVKRVRNGLGFGE